MRNYFPAYLTSLKKSITGLSAGLAAGMLMAFTAAGCGATAQDQTLGRQTFQYSIPPITSNGFTLPPGLPLPSIMCAVASDCSKVFTMQLGVDITKIIPGLSMVCDAG